MRASGVADGRGDPVNVAHSMARFNEPIEPMTLGNMRENGVRSLWVQCNQCRHTTVMNVDHPSPTISPCIRAADGVHEVGTIGADARGW